MEIEGKFTIRNGRFDNETSKFVDIKERAYTKILTMETSFHRNELILRFIGGPTGFESFYVKDLLKNPIKKDIDFCICAGTVNTWPKCTVNRKQVFDFIDYEIERLNYNLK